MKKIIVTLIFCISAICTSVYAEKAISVYLDNQKIEFDVDPIATNGRTLIPVRAVFEAMGAKVDWDSSNNLITISAPGVHLQLPLKENVLYRNTIKESIDVPAQVINNRTLVPLRVISEYMGAIVSWNPDTNAVHITSTDKIQPVLWNDHFIYYGEINNNQPDGYGGLYRINDGTVVQLGIHNSQSILQGTRYYDNGDVFSGNFKEDEPSDGVYKFANDGSVYSGEFESSIREGYGTMYYSDGSYYKGYWKDDTFNGKGTLYDYAQNISYTGNWTDGEMDGKFTIKNHYNNTSISAIYRDGDLYDNIDAYNDAYEELIEWLETEQEKIYEAADKKYTALLNQQIAKLSSKYNVNSAVANGYSYGKAAAQYQAALMELQSSISAEQSTYISNQLQVLNKTFEKKVISLKAQYGIGY